MKNSDAILERFIMLGVSQINKEKDMDRIISSLENFSKKWQD